MDSQQSRIFETVKVLYVEADKSDVAFLINEILCQIAEPLFDIDVAGTIAESKEMYYRKKYDIILLNLYLPNGKGIECVEKVMEFARSVPVVVMSEYDDETLSQRAVRHGAQDYLIKGQFNAKGFKRAMNHALYRKERLNKRTNESLERVKQDAIDRLLAIQG